MHADAVHPVLARSCALISPLGCRWVLMQRKASQSDAGAPGTPPRSSAARRARAPARAAGPAARPARRPGTRPAALRRPPALLSTAAVCLAASRRPTGAAEAASTYLRGKQAGQVASDSATRAFAREGVPGAASDLCSSRTPRPRSGARTSDAGRKRGAEDAALEPWHAAGLDEGLQLPAVETQRDQGLELLPACGASLAAFAVLQ